MMNRRKILALTLSACGLPALWARADALKTDTASAPDSLLDPLSQNPAEAPELILFKDIPIVVAAAKHEQTQQQAPASVSIVDASDIELFGYRSLADVLRNQRSFYLTTDGLNWFAGVRGFLRPGEWNARTLVLVDGRPTREPIFSQTHIDPDFVVPLEAVKRIEIVRGPGSALYGSNAVFGVINVVTKDASDVAGVGQVKGQVGTQETGRASALLGHHFENGWDILATASHFETSGDKHITYDGVNDAAHNFGHINDYDSEGNSAAFFKAKKGDFTFEINGAKRLKDNRSATYDVSWFDPGSMLEERASLSAHFDHNIGEGQSFHAQVYYGYYRYRQSWEYDDDGLGNPYRYFSEAESNWVGEEVHYDFKAAKSINVTVGADGTQTLSTQQADHDTLNEPLVDSDNAMNMWAIFAEAEWTASKWLSITAGLRLDKVQRLDPFWSPRFAAILNPSRDDTVKLLYGRAFRAPNLYEMFYSSPGYNTPNPDLQPEIVDTYELVYERQWKEGWSSSFNLYYWKMDQSLRDVIIGDGSSQVQNLDGAYAQGVEFEIDKRWNSGARFRAYATLERAIRDGQPMPQSPQWITGVSAAIPLFAHNTFLAVEPQIVGPMKSDNQSDYSDPTYITNVVLTSKDIFKNVDLQIGVYNLFSTYARLPRFDPSVHAQPWLNYPETLGLVTLTYRF